MLLLFCNSGQWLSFVLEQLALLALLLSVFLAGSGGFGCFGAVVSREYAAVSSNFCAGWLLSSAVFGVGRPVFAVFWCYPPVDQFVSVLEMISELYESFI
ncbi:transmembrane protein, putative [Medicago truncatula]|uniref:Transmembrane protein, putative n=1 Tax=Medicago truncatula TaxID=3880 RepID=A0A072V8E5_MEDTR|nr:transmembrane protein, putative [Medicago truncatula]